MSHRNFPFASRIPEKAGLVFLALQQTHGKGMLANSLTCGMVLAVLSGMFR